MPEQPPPTRYCHGCEQYDTAPRAIVAVDINRPDLDKLYHYDCLPQTVIDQDAHPDGTQALGPILDAVNDGTRDDDLREVAVAHAASIEEAPADKPSRGKD